MKPKHLRRLMAASILPVLCLVNGCVVLPLPANSFAAGSRSNVRAEDTEWLVSGRTSREDVLLRLGEPDEASSDDSRLIYRWQWISTVVVWAAAGGYGGAAGHTASGRDYALELVFDAEWKLKSWDLRRSKLGGKEASSL